MYLTGELETTTAVVIESITVNETISVTGELVTTTPVVIESITINDTINTFYYDCCSSL
jgi:hypothetical protein